MSKAGQLPIGIFSQGGLFAGPPSRPAASPCLPPGEISVSNTEGLDFELQPRLRLVLQAESPTSFSFMAVTVNLQDVNDNQPRFQLQNYVAFVGEAQGYDLPVIQVLW